MLTLIAITATVSGLVCAFLPAIQIAKMCRARSSVGISIPYLVGGYANNIVWTVYACALPSVALILPNLVALVMNTAMVTVAVRHRPRDAEAPSVAHLAQAVVRDDALAAELAQLLAEEHERAVAKSDVEDTAIRRRGALIAALANA